ncbi:unnamed protein product, partial [Ectocarpus sp. 13 AM-2016]
SCRCKFWAFGSFLCEDPNLPRVRAPIRGATRSSSRTKPSMVRGFRASCGKGVHGKEAAAEG